MMRRFIRLFTLSKASYSVLPLAFLVLCEKQAEELGSSIVLVRLLFVIGLLVAVYYNPTRIYNQLVARRLLFMTTLLILLIPYVPYVVAAMSPVITTMFQNVSKYMMDKGVKYNDKNKVNTRLTVLYSITSLLIYGAVSVVEVSNLYLLLVVVITYVAMIKAIKIWVTHDTREHFITNQHQINASVSLNVHKPNYKLRDSIKIKELIIVFVIYVLTVSTIPAIATLYVHDTLKDTQQSQFAMITVMMLGGLISSKFHSYIGARVRVSFMMQYSIFFVGVLMFMLYGKVNIYYIYGALFVLGLMQEVIFKSVLVSVHQNSAEKLLKKRLSIIKLITYGVPVLSVASVFSVSILEKIEDMYLYLTLGFISVMTVALLITVRLFRPRSRDMTYQRYR